VTGQPARHDLSAIKEIRPRTLTRRFWHQGPTGRVLLSFPSPATYGARYHRAGSEGAWYASSRERAAWAELFRHHRSPELSPFEVRRRVGRIRVEGLAVLDLTDPEVLERIGVTEDELVSDDLSLCQAIGERASNAGFDGILAPSAALPGEATLTVFPNGMKRVVEEHSRIQRPPRTLTRLLRQIRAAAGSLRKATLREQ
jgi:RES domain-containing protein